MTDQAKVITDDSLRSSLTGRPVWRGDEGYEKARVETIWNGYKPERFPAVIVRPETVNEIAEAVRFAGQQGLKVKAKSGGHNWTASFMRDDSMLIDLGAINDIQIDAINKSASLGPAVKGQELQAELVKHNLFFPTGHCADVAVGGYLLQGGWGWNVPKMGLANGMLESIELVTAQGDVIHASALENEDFFWAARGAGAGFFGIVTRFNIRLTPRPALCVSSALYRQEDLHELLIWATALGPSLPHEIEMNVFMIPGLDQMVPGGFVLVNSACFAPTTALATQILQSVNTCPIRDRALINEVGKPATVQELYTLLKENIYIKGWRFGVDNMLTNAQPKQIIDCIMKMVSDIPTPLSHVLWHPYPIDRVVTDTSMAIMATNYVVGYAASADIADDEKVQSWATTHMKAFEPLAVGMQLGDENLLSRPNAVILKPGAAEKLERLREKYDPNGLFLSYLRG